MKWWKEGIVCVFESLKGLFSVDYLAEIELGTAPPKEFIEKNLKYNPDEYRNTKELNDVLQHGQEYIEEAQDRIEDAMLDVII